MVLKSQLIQETKPTWLHCGHSVHVPSTGIHVSIITDICLLVLERMMCAGTEGIVSADSVCRWYAGDQALTSLNVGNCECSRTESIWNARWLDFCSKS